MPDDPTEHSSHNDLEESLMNETQNDARLSSSTHSATGDADLDFINMTGLIAPLVTNSPAQDSITADYSQSDLDPEAPLSFYEEGVNDVDTSMDPANTSILDDDEILGRTRPSPPSAASSPTLEGLHDIISELTQDDHPDPSTPIPEEQPPDLETLAPVETEALPDELEISSCAEVEDLENINLEAASTALNDLNLLDEPSDVDSAKVSSLIASIDFGEAELLLEELESQDRDIPEPIVPIKALETPEIEIFMESDTPSVDPEPETEATDHPSTSSPSLKLDLDKISIEEPGEIDSSVYSKPPLPKSPPRHKRRRSLGANLLLFFLAFTLMIVAIGFAYFSLEQYTTKTLTPQEAYADGLALIDQGQYAKASNHFTAFPRRYPVDPLTSDALFMAAYALQLTPAEPRIFAQNAYNESLIKFSTFINTYPAHEKTARAETLIGIINYKVGNYPEAIRILSNPKRRLRDTHAYLPTLRTLARAYAEQSDMKNAENTFVRAATLNENIAPGKDYIELASIYDALGKNAPDPATRIHYMQQAVEFWDRAIRLPGVLAVKKNELQILRDYTLDELASIGSGPDPSTVPSAEALPDPTESPASLEIESLRLPGEAP